MAKDKVSMPQSTGGLIRYFDEYKSTLQMKPGLIIVLVVVVIIISIILHTYGKTMLGLP
ncbi:preprotein translocase subunit Sec61beta [Candidatus Woesearchaeota archaeon]|jgi:preprotein translocase subunit Sec61beta|nr:preprotein translocase subunit Sec61beta [Candidatus Woesearchaeota archaeon]MBT5271757.1 preprotein translocase subunit Sec61beta [Candidatus Woesearchaeota archaeon]MBT6041564.1 preprotein translocase subunit Sec61beta [Candidatus Woesearchaeota archaeon]MBT6337379.1 preprotein translocase subunit Sec61beta [Candidatus Woesearchaeota archaeon]MBT7927291.1 preprotein translocase subunit Sec61beta [Candidatus Woesearchaeota archaeon]